MGTENVGLVPRYQDKPSSCCERSRSLGSLSQRDPGRGGSGGTEMLPSHPCSGVRAVPPAGSESRTWPQGNIYKSSVQRWDMRVARQLLATCYYP